MGDSMKFTFSLKSNRVFKYVIKKGKFSSKKHISVHVAKNKSKDINNLGVCVSKKNGNSVQRNKLKRWVRESYKVEEKALRKGFNIVVILRKDTTVSNVEFFCIKDELSSCLKDLDIYEKK